MERDMTPLTYQQASEVVGVSLETIKKAVLRGVLTRLPRTGLYQHLMAGQVELFKGKMLSLSVLSEHDRKLWQAYADRSNEKGACMLEAHDTVWYSRKTRFKEQVEAHLANLLQIGMSREQMSERGYEYALALQSEQERTDSPVSATMMARATELVKDALPGAYRLYELRNQMR